MPAVDLWPGARRALRAAVASHKSATLGPRTCAAILDVIGDLDVANEYMGPDGPGQPKGTPTPPREHTGPFCERHWSWLCQAGQGECQKEETP